MTAKSLLFAVWANNHGGDAGDSVVDVRRSRHDDVARSSAKWDRVAAAVKADRPRRPGRRCESAPASLLGGSPWLAKVPSVRPGVTFGAPPPYNSGLSRRRGRCRTRCEFSRGLGSPRRRCHRQWHPCRRTRPPASGLDAS